MEETFEDFASDQEFDGFDDDAIANVLDLMNDGNSSKTAIASTIKSTLTPSPPPPRSPAAPPRAPRNINTSTEDSALDDLMASIDSVLRKVRTEELDEENEEHSPPSNEKVKKPLSIEKEEVVPPKAETLPPSSQNTRFNSQEEETNVAKADSIPKSTTITPTRPESLFPIRSEPSISLPPHLVSLASNLYEKIMETYLEPSTFGEKMLKVVNQSNLIPFILSIECFDEMLKPFEKESFKFQIFLKFIHAFGTIQHKNIQTFVSIPEERIEFFLVVMDSSTLDAFSIDIKRKWEGIIQNVIQFGKMELKEKKWSKAMKMHQSLASSETEQPKRRVSSSSTVDTVRASFNSATTSESVSGSSEEAFRLAKDAARLQNFKMPTRKDIYTETNLARAVDLNRNKVMASQLKRRRSSLTVWNPQDKELTFKPKVNRISPYIVYHTEEEAQMGPKERFVSRMQRDISKRREEQTIKIGRASASSKRAGPISLISKMSKKILEQNGNMEETREERINRLLKSKDILLQEIQQKAKQQEQMDLKTGRKFFVPLINEPKQTKKNRQVQQQHQGEGDKDDEEESDSTWVCESLYLRGIERKLRHEQKILQREQQIRMDAGKKKMISNSTQLMEQKLQKDIEMIFYQTFEQGPVQESKTKSNKKKRNTIRFLQFSYGLIFFGLLPDIDTPLPSNWHFEMTSITDDDHDGSRSVTTASSNNTHMTLVDVAWALMKCEDLEDQDDDDNKEEEDTTTNKNNEQEHVDLELFQTLVSDVILSNQATHLKDLFLSRTTSTASNLMDQFEKLVGIFRLHYISRRRKGPFDFKTFYSDMKKIASAGSQTKTSTSTNKTPACHLEYSIHGKPLTTIDALLDREKQTELKLQRMKERKEKNELQECTFTPRIHPIPSNSTDGQVMIQQDQDDDKNIFQRLHDEAMERQQIIVEKCLEKKKNLENLEKQQLSNVPSIFNGKKPEQRLADLYVTMNQEPLPVDFDKKILEMRQILIEKQLEKIQKEKKLVPTKNFEKTPDGKTIVIPFNLATEKRYPSMKTSKMTSIASPDIEKQHFKVRMMKEIRKRLAEMECSSRDFSQTQKEDGLKEAEEEAVQQKDFRIQVHLSPLEMYTFDFDAQDDLEDLVERFGRQKLLETQQKQKLLQFLQEEVQKSRQEEEEGGGRQSINSTSEQLLLPPPPPRSVTATTKEDEDMASKRKPKQQHFTNGQQQNNNNHNGGDKFNVQFLEEFFNF